MSWIIATKMTFNLFYHEAVANMYTYFQYRNWFIAVSVYSLIIGYNCEWNATEYKDDQKKKISDDISGNTEYANDSLKKFDVRVRGRI